MNSLIFGATIRVPNLRDRLIVAEVGIRACARESLSYTSRPAQPLHLRANLLRCHPMHFALFLDDLRFVFATNIRHNTFFILTRRPSRHAGCPIRDSTWSRVGFTCCWTQPRPSQSP